MAVASNRRTTIEFSGEITDSLTFAAAENDDAPGSITLHTLAAGANTITVPTGGTTVVAATIIPPPANAETLTLKGVSGDTGIPLSKTDPTTITFDDPAPTDFVLTAGAEIAGLRIVWS